MVRLGKVRATRSAIEGGVALGFSYEGLISTVLQLTMEDFYKSMTSYADSAVWQDVYRPQTLQEKAILN